MSDYISYRPVEDQSTILKNPAMGWVLYIEEFEHSFPDAEEYWIQIDPYIEPASILYIRVPWSRMEPLEGHYAWNEDRNFIKLVQMALDRGIKLAFRIFVDSQDAQMQATPQFVFEAGAKGYRNLKNQNYKTPYLMDQVFRVKFENFVEAFANEYDDPAKVDYIDGQGLGWWGEMHNVDFMTADEKTDTFQWVTNTYSSQFSHVLLGGQYGSGSFRKKDQNWALYEKGYLIRRDSLGSPIWLKNKDKKEILEHWPEFPVFAENCFHHFEERQTWWQEVGYRTYRDMMAGVLKDAYEIHANTLDLRIARDTIAWLTYAPELVCEFAVKGGYRFVPTEISYPQKIELGNQYEIHHIWKNTGVGKLPNNLPNWNYKYKVSFALLDKESGEPVYQELDNAEPAHWLRGKDYSYIATISVQDISEGTYDLGVAIINKELNNRPEIKLAITSDQTSQGWYKIGEVTVNSRIG